MSHKYLVIRQIVFKMDLVFYLKNLVQTIKIKNYDTSNKIKPSF